MKTIFKSLPVLIFCVAAALSVVLSAAVSTGCDKKGKYLEVTPNRIVFMTAGNSELIRVSSSSEWMFSSGADWITCEYAKADKNLLVVTAAANVDPVDRASEIVITSSDGQMVSVAVSQPAPSPESESRSGRSEIFKTPVTY